jgi:hypothetical protein
MKRPRIHGDEADCRAAVAAYIQRAKELLDEAVGVRERVVALTGSQDFPPWEAANIENDWAREVRLWFNGARHEMGEYLQTQLQDVLPIIEVGLPLATPRPGYAIDLDKGEPWLRDALKELQGLQRALGYVNGHDLASAATCGHL